MSALAQVTDAIFFEEHRDREFRIRLPAPGERLQEFRALGGHNEDRRRIIAWKVPAKGRLMPGAVLCIPFLLFADETINDDDATLRPIVHELMMDANEEYGIELPKGRA